MSLKTFIRPALIVMVVAFVWRYARSVISEHTSKPEPNVRREE